MSSNVFVAATAATSRLRGLARGKGALQSALLATTAFAFSGGSAFALPTGAQVEAGGITIVQPNATNLVINQSTDKAIINWKGFDIDANEATRFNQPGSNSIALNRVNSGKQTQILGSLTANGRVVVVNPNGVFFGAGSKVDVAGLVATTANINSADFMAGSMKFDKPGAANGSIVNEGTISASEGGLVALVAPSVRNDGVIAAKLGTVALGAGQAFSVDMYGDNLYSFKIDKTATTAGIDQNGKLMKVALENNGAIQANGGTVLLTANMAKDVVDKAINNTGIIEAKSASVDQVGTIVLDGGEGGVRVAGTLDASGIQAGQKGGNVQVLGSEVQLASNALVNVSGDAAGGAAQIGGDFKGQGALRLADATKIDQSATINASSRTGTAGKVVVWSEKTTDFKGKIDISSVAGKGGAAEVSSRSNLAYKGTTDARGANGNVGSLLLDPHNILVSSGVDDGYNSINNTALANQLDLANVTLSTNGAGSDEGHITVIDDVIWSGTGSLALIADKNIVVNASIEATGSNPGIITLSAGNDIFIGNGSADLGVGSLFGNVTLNAGHNISIAADNFDTDVVSGFGTVSASAGNIFQLVSGGNSGHQASFGSIAGDTVVDAHDVTLTSVAGAGTSTLAGGSTLKVNVAGDVIVLGQGSIEGGDITIDQAGVFFSDTAGVINNTDATGSILVNQNLGFSIQNLVDAIGTVGTGGATIQLGAGEFDDRIDIDKNLTLQGALGTGGALLTTIGMDTSYTLADGVVPSYVNADGIYIPLIYVHDTDNVTLRNFKVDGKADTISQPLRLDLVAFDNAGGTVDNLDLKNFNTPANNGFAIFADAADGDSARFLTILNSNIASDGWGAIFVNGNKLSTQIFNNTISVDAFDTDSNQVGIMAKRGTAADIDGNSLVLAGDDTNGMLRFIEVDGAATNGVTLNFNSISAGTRQAGIHIANTTGTLVTGNDILGTGIGIFADVAANNTVIDGATVQGARVGALILNNNGTTLNDVDTNGGVTGISIAGSSNVTLTNVDVSNTGTGFQILNGTDTNISNSSATNITTHGLRADDTANLTVDHVTVTSTGINGIRLANVNGAAVTSNIIDQAYGNGVAVLDSTNVDVNDNLITNSGINGIYARNVQNLALDGNNVDLANQAGIFVEASDGASITNSVVNNSAFGFIGLNSDNLFHSANSYGANGIGGFVINSDNATLTGDVFTNNANGVVLAGSNNTRIVGATIANPANGTGILLVDDSGNAILRDVILTGGTAAVVVSGTGSSLQFENNGSQFSNVGSYFILDDGAMAGTTLDASQQTFDGVRGVDFTPAQLAAAEGITTDVEDNATLGDVFYTAFPSVTPPAAIAPAAAAPAATGGTPVVTLDNQALDQFQRDRSLLFREGLFSYAGRTVNNNLAETPFSFQVATVNLSLLAPAAGGATGGQEAQLANLSTAAGGPGTGAGSAADQLADLSPAAGGATANCGNSFLGAGYSPNFEAASCSTSIQ